MAVSGGKLRELVRIHTVLSLAIVALTHLMLLDDDDDDDDDAPGIERSFGRRPNKPPRTAPLYEQEYFSTIAQMRDAYSKSGHTRLLRFRAFAISALALSSAVPVVVAAGSPGWIVAAISAGAAITQGSQLVLRDHALGVNSHAMAAALSRALRIYTVEASVETGSKSRQAFNTLVARVEGLQEDEGANLIQIMRESHTTVSPHQGSESVPSQTKKPPVRSTPKPILRTPKQRAADTTAFGSPNYGRTSWEPDSAAGSYTTGHDDDDH